MKNLFIVFLLLLGVNARAQSDYDRSTDKENGSVVLRGQMTFDDLLKENSFDWLESGAAGYTPNNEALEYLKKELGEYEIVIFAGTWCDDSKLWLPRLYKVMQAANYPMRRYSMYGVDRAKTSKYVENKLYKIELVPTIILLKKNKEIGRIVENPQKTLEQDMVGFIKKDKAATH
ncbi:MAG TPA: thioredoxin domain-containing protein [Flavipsychrobacter sp.]|nr:thioredoxin domain-containing protein [Flavipsychrobacter sp.]